MTDIPGPLAGYRIVDMSHHMAGPAATQRLGDLGADVIKVEPPVSGDWTRSRPIGDVWVGKMNASFLSLNRNKRSIELNLKNVDGYELFTQLIASADVLVLNFRPRVCERLHVDYESVHAINPSLVYCSITGFGSEGPWRDRPGQDLLVQAFSGVTWNGGVNDGPPVAAPTFVADATTSNHAVIGILAAILDRQSTGVGGKVEVDLMSSMMDIQTQELTTYLNSGVLSDRPEERLAHPLINAPYGLHQTKDGWIAIAMAEAPALAEALHLEEFSEISDWAEAFRRREEIFSAVSIAVRKLTTSQAVEALDEHNIWCGPVQNYAQLVEHPQVVASSMVEGTTGPEGEPIRLVSSPIRISGQSRKIARRPPSLGEHTDEILQEIGISTAAIDAHRESGAIG